VNLQDQAADVATQTAQLFTTAFTGMTDAIVNFA
jgi:lambda family phage tail tape measure protein